MRKFIQIRDGQPFEHPVLESNMRMVFADMDLDNLPEGWAEFVRIPMPELGPYQVYQGVEYRWIDGKVQDVHLVRDMTPSEREEKARYVKEQWTTGGGFASWIFNEEKCIFEPPIPYPESDEIMVWDEPSISWQPVNAPKIVG